jgi:hypothetical protein
VAEHAACADRRRGEPEPVPGTAGAFDLPLGLLHLTFVVVDQPLVAVEVCAAHRTTSDAVLAKPVATPSPWCARVRSAPPVAVDSAEYPPPGRRTRRAVRQRVDEAERRATGDMVAGLRWRPDHHAGKRRGSST